MSLDELLSELTEKHTKYFPIYRHNIPTSVLSFSASEHLNIVSKERSSSNAYENFDKIEKAVELYRDFVDPMGEDEMTRLFRKIL